MITVLAHRSALVGLKWFPPTPECLVRYGEFCGHAIGREPWGGVYEWLHVPSETVAKEILAGCMVDAGIYGKEKAVELVGKDWPLVEVDQGITKTKGIPTIAGGSVVTTFSHDGEPVDGWTVQNGQVFPVAISAVAPVEVDKP